MTDPVVQAQVRKPRDGAWVLSDVLKVFEEAAKRGEYYLNIRREDIVLAYLGEEYLTEYAEIVLRNGVVLRAYPNGYIRVESLNECYCRE